MYRAVKALDSSDVIAIGMDEGQGGKPYHDMGVWCEFTFEKIPEVPADILSSAMGDSPAGGAHTSKILLKVVDDTIVVKSLEEIQ